jgi:hypothetical protein
VGHWSFIARLITPFAGVPDVTQAQGSVWGLGDFNPQLYLTLQLKNGFTFGLGPTLQIPTATDAALGSGRFSLGPSFVVVYINGPVVTGLLINNAWSVAGDPSRSNVNAFFAQPFFNLNLPHHTFLITAPEITANWVNGNWVIPVGGGAGAILKLGLPANVNLQAYWNAHAPPGSPTWITKLNIAFLFPEKHKR